jgi:hypothetical protein
MVFSLINVIPVVEDVLADYNKFLLSDIDARLKVKMEQFRSTNPMITQASSDWVPALTRSCIKEAYKEYQFRRGEVSDISPDSVSLIDVEINNKITQISLPRSPQRSLEFSGFASPSDPGYKSADIMDKFDFNMNLGGAVTENVYPDPGDFLDLWTGNTTY